VSQFKPGDLVYGTGNRWKGDVISMWGAHVGASVSAAAGYKPVPEGLSRETLDSLAFAVLCGVSNRGINFADPKAGQKSLHIGAGIVGVCAAQLASLRGCEPVLIDKAPERIAYIREAFPQIPCYSVDDADLLEVLKKEAPQGFDLLQDTVGHAATTDMLVPLVKAQGTLLLQAQYFDKKACAVDLDQIKIRELTVKTTCGTRQEDWEQTSANIIEGRLDVSPLITHTLNAPEDLLQGYQLLHTGKPHNIGIVFHW
jgi:threonine dehydrogenase-like Zn-dependent dehydrogenase